MKPIRCACILLTGVLSACEAPDSELRFRQATRLINEDGIICADGSIHRVHEVRTTWVTGRRVTAEK